MTNQALDSSTTAVDDDDPALFDPGWAEWKAEWECEFEGFLQGESEHA